MGERGPKPRTQDHRDLARRLAKAPLPVGEIQEIYGISQRTAYRWLDVLEAGGADLIRRRIRGRSAWAVIA